MPLSSTPSGGPSLPGGVRRVSIKTIDTTASTAKEDVTTLADDERVYADPPLKDPGASGGATMTCSASGFLTGGEFSPTPAGTTTGWIMEDCDFVYEVGKYATWSANWSYYPPAEE